LFLYEQLSNVAEGKQKESLALAALYGDLTWPNEAVAEKSGFRRLAYFNKVLAL